MKTVIAGSRHYNNYKYFCDRLANHKHTISSVVSGGCYGVDRMAEMWARANNLPLEIVPANWLLGPKAGPLRNKTMMKMADQLIAFWDRESKGTKHIINYCKEIGKPCVVIMIC